MKLESSGHPYEGGKKGDPWPKERKNSCEPLCNTLTALVALLTRT